MLHGWTLACGVWSLAFVGACAGSTESTLAADDPNSTSAADTERSSSLRGHLLGNDGAPVPRAALHLRVAGASELSIPVGPDGAFSIELPSAGWVELRVSGVNHADHTVEFLAAPGEHAVEVRLGTYSRPAELESALTGFGRFDGVGSTINFVFTRGADGTWVAKIPRPKPDPEPESGSGSPEFHYQLRNATSEGRTMNGTQADRYVYDGGGDFFSVVTLANDDSDAFEIVWDPGALPPSGLELGLDFTDPNSLVARSARLHADLNAEREAVRAEVAAELASGEAQDYEAEFAAVEARLRTRLAAAATAESDAELRKLLWVAWAATLEPEPSAAERTELGVQVQELLKLVGPRDPVWSMSEWAMPTALAYVEDPEYFAIAAAEHPDATVGAALWLVALVEADRDGALERAREAMLALAGPRYADAELVGMASMYDPDRITAPGRQVPDFRIQSADGKAEFTASDLRGKTYVLDFWATWCGPCMAEMPALHAAYANVNGQGPVEGRAYVAVADPRVELISISFDHDRAIVDKFRKEVWPMPWLHAVPDEATHRELSKLFGISAIPTMILVGPDGTILASSPRLDGGSLAEIAGATP